MKASQKWKVLAVVALGPCLSVMDNTVITVILSQMQNAFHTDVGTITWAVTAYFLAQAAVIPIVGYLSDHFGSKVVFMTALAVFTAASALCALAPTKEVLFASRALQGIGGGALVPMAFAINYRIFPPEERGLATAVISIPILLAPALGPTVAGYLSVTFNWNAVFAINVPIGIVTLLLVFLVLPGSKSDGSAVSQTKGTRKGFDIPGLLLSLVSVIALVYGINQASSNGWGDPTVLTSILIGTAVLIAFIVVELRVSDPVLDLRLFLNYTFTIANLLTWLIIAVFYGSLFLLPLFFESVRGYSGLVAGSFLISQLLGLGVSITIAGVLYNRVGPRILTTFGLLLLVIGTYGLTQIDANTTGQSLQIWLTLRGLGIGFVSQPLQTLSLSVVSNKGMAKASSLVNATRQMITAIAVVALTTYLTEQTATHATDTGVATTCAQATSFKVCVAQHALAIGMANTFWIILILSALCIPLALVMGRDPAIEALKKAKERKEAVPSTLGVSPAATRRVISTLAANGEQMMGPANLLWHYPEDNITNGSLLIVDNNHFCILKSYGTILNVYEAGQHIVQSLDSSAFDLVQLAFSDEPIPLQYKAIYVNRIKVPVRFSSITVSDEMIEVDYQVDYYIHIVTREDAVKLVLRMPYQGHTLNIQDINAYAGPVIEQIVNQLVRVTPVEQVNRKIQDLSEQIHWPLQQCLFSYGITLDEVKVLGFRLHDERMKALISLKAFGLSELDAVYYYTAMQKNSAEHRLKEQQELLVQSLEMVWRNAEDRYRDQITALQTELESIRTDIGLRIDAHSASLQELSHAINNDFSASLPALKMIPLSDPQRTDSTRQFRGPLVPIGQYMETQSERMQAT